MAWYKFPDIRFLNTRRQSVGSFQVNERCFIRKEHECGKVFGASKSCFIACPTDDDLEPILGLMSEKLTKVGIEPIIAVKERAYGQDIFCTKICGKIIEAKFCIVILDDSIIDKQNIPNPNVYYEYGLMTALRKHIIPLQKEGLELAFNIQSYDTIKYTMKNIPSELDRAIRDAIRITEAKEHEETQEQLSEKEILREMELAGFSLKDSNWFLNDVIDDTAFKGFGHHEAGFYTYLGKIDNNEDLNTYRDDLRVIVYRTEKKVIALQDELNELMQKKKQREEDIQAQEAMLQEQGVVVGGRSRNVVLTTRSREYLDSSIDSQISSIENKLKMMSTLYIGFIINTEVRIEQFKHDINEIIPVDGRYQIVYSCKGLLTFDRIDVNLQFSM